MHRYRWGPEDVDLLHLAPDDEERDASIPAGFYIHIDCELTAGDDENVKKVIHALFRCDEAEDLPRHVESQQLPKFLEDSFPLVPCSHDGWMRQDLLVAVYDEGSLSSVYSSAPKNPQHHQRPEIWFLAGPPAGQADWPKCFFTAPQATPDAEWQRWLETVNQSRSDGSNVVKLFYKLPARSASADYYVEYGWRHLVPHLPELHEPEDARWILVPPVPPWTRIVPLAGHTMFHGSASRVFDIQLPQSVRSITLSTTPPRKIPLGLRLRHVAVDARSDLEKLEQRIQATKEKLFRMERERAMLVGRKRSRFRFLLRFEETNLGQSDGSLCSRFKRFLRLSEQRLDRFQYGYQEDEHGGYHVVLTSEACYCEDLHLWLADEVYYQMDYWQERGFNVFVAEHFEFMPVIDGNLIEAVHESLQKSLDDAVDRSDEPADKRCLLLRPLGTESTYDDPGLPFTVTPVVVPHSLTGALEFLNTAFPKPERTARNHAADELKGELERHAASLRTEVQQMEHSLTEEAERRLAKLRGEWNELSAKIENDYGLVQHLEVFYGTIDQMVQQFSHQWSDFVGQFFDVTDRLVADKIHAFDDLASQHQEWQDVRSNVEISHRDVSTELRKVRDEMFRRVQEAEAGRGATRAEFATTKEKYEENKPRADKAAAEVREMLESAGRDAAKIEEKRREVDEHVRRTQRLQGTVEDGTSWLKKHRECFGQIVAAARDDGHQAKKSLEELDSLGNEITQLVADWQETHDDAVAMCHKAAELRQQADQVVPTLREQFLSSVKKASPLAREAEKKTLRLEREQHQARKAIRKLEECCNRVKQESDQLKKLRDQAEDLKKQISQEKDEREEVIGQLVTIEQEFSLQQSSMARELVAEISRLMKDISVLSKMEASLQNAARIRQAAKLQSELAQQYTKCRPLTDDEYGNMWKK